MKARSPSPGKGVGAGGHEPEEALRLEGRSSTASLGTYEEARRRLTYLLIYAVALVDGADVQLLPATFRALEATVHLSPSNLATLSMAQALTMAMAAPMWGTLVDQGWSRKWVLTCGVTGWGFLTMCLALVQGFNSMLLLRTLNGAVLATLLPVSQSLVAGMTTPQERGFQFGMIQMSQNLGCVSCAIFATTISNKRFKVPYFGDSNGMLQGWRAAFLVIAALSFCLAASLALLMREPPRPAGNAEGDSARDIGNLRRYMRIDTFKIIVIQGIFGSVPWNALSFATMYFQYVGFTDFDASLIFAASFCGSAIGGPLGGTIGDALARASRYHGRAFTAQFSVACGIPLVFVVFHVLSPGTSTETTFLVLMFAFGLLSSWCAAGANRPILTEITGQESWASIIAWTWALEGSSAAVFGAPMVGLLAEQSFGYRPSSLQVKAMDPALRRSNRAALSQAIVCCTVGPWIVCFLCYTMLHWTYRRDVGDGAALDLGGEVRRLSAGAAPLVAQRGDDAGEASRA